MSLGIIVDIVLPAVAFIAASSGIFDIVRSWLKKKSSSDNEIRSSIKHLMVTDKDGIKFEIKFSAADEVSILKALKKIEGVPNGKCTESK